MNIMRLIECNARLREQNVALTCLVIYLTVRLVRVEFKLFKKETETEGE